MKIIGYILAIVGIIGVAAYSIPQIKAALPLPPQITDTILIVVSLVLAVIGVFIIFKSRGGRGGKQKEVPIFRGKDVVGYRRTK